MNVFDPKALRRIMQDRDLSVAELARTLHVPTTTVSGWLNARHRPAWGNIERMARILDVPVEELLRTVTTMTPGIQGGVALSLSQALVLAVAVALVAEDADRLVDDWLLRLRPAEREAIWERLVVSPQWVWAWEKLSKLGVLHHPLVGYRVTVQIVPPKKMK